MANEYPVPSSNAETTAIATTNGQTAFSFDWRADAADQVHAVYRPVGAPERVLILGEDFSVQGLQNPSGGSILLVGLSVKKNDVIYMYRETLIEREKKWQNEGDYKADLVNREQDDIYMIMQENRRDVRSNAGGLNAEIAARIAGDEALSGRVTIIENEIEGIVERANEAADRSEEYRDQAEEYRDQAAGYVNDISMEKEVPIYSTVAGMPLIPVPSGILAVQILGRNALLDAPLTDWKRVASEPDASPYLKFRTVDRFLPDGTEDAALGGWWEMQTKRPQVDQFEAGLNIQSRLDYMQARMAAGETVNIACYGDSTTDGNSTTGHVRNPVDGSGNAIGQSDHNLTAPNAWPKKTQDLLRAMHGNNNINVWNAGYSGRQIINGWAYANYERAIISNPFYGVPDAVFVAFGLNDAATAGSSYQETKDHTLKLCLKIISYGSVPVLLSCDANGRTTDAHDNREVTRQVDAAKRAVASELGIPFIEMGEEQEKWLELNQDGFKFGRVQPDLLHFGDDGHKFKAMVAAKSLFVDLVHVDKGRPNFSFFSKVGGGRNGEATSVVADSARPGINFTLALADVPLGARLMDCWVWNDKPDGSLIYRGISTEATNVETGLITTGHAIQVESILTGVRKKVIPTVGFAQGTVGYRGTDIPYIFGHLPYGLSRVSYIRGATSSNSAYYGYFDFREISRGSRNALSKTGPQVRYHSGSGLTEHTAYFQDEASDGSNLWGALGTETQDLLIDATIPLGTGIILAGNKGWATNWDTDDADRRGLIMYRSNTGLFRLYHLRYAENAPAKIAFSAVGDSSFTDFGTGDRFQFRFRCLRNGDEQSILVYNGWGWGSVVMRVSVLNTEVNAGLAGTLGGFFFNHEEIGVSASPMLHEAIIV